MTEVNLANPYALSEGVAFAYFKDCEIKKRISKFNDSPERWWLRSPYTNYPRAAWYIMSDGQPDIFTTFEYYGRRSAFVLPESLSIDYEGNVML